LALADTRHGSFVFLWTAIFQIFMPEKASLGTSLLWMLKMCFHHWCMFWVHTRTAWNYSVKHIYQHISFLEKNILFSFSGLSLVNLLWHLTDMNFKILNDTEIWWHRLTNALWVHITLKSHLISLIYIYQFFAERALLDY